MHRHRTRPGHLLPALLVLAAGLGVLADLAHPPAALAIGRPKPRLELENRTLVLHGWAVKSTRLVSAPLYRVALYAEPDATITGPDTTGVQVIAVRFLVSVPREKLARAWIDDLHRHCPSDCERLLAEAGALAAHLPDVRRGQTVYYRTDPTGVTVRVEDRVIGRLAGAAATLAVRDAFYGPTTDPKLRAGLLGRD